MIPVRLTLRNFMSYGDTPTTLDFTGIHVACLSGDNGNGKSAILDAITYALWDETRAKGTQAVKSDSIIRHGASDLEVVLEFLLGDDSYRVTRKRSKRTNSGSWQLDLLSPNGSWQPVGETGTRATAEALLRLLRVDHESFRSSAYIQQGNADHFTSMKPNDRKKVLAEILDLRKYDELEKLAREEKSNAESIIRSLEGEINVHLGVVSREPEVAVELSEGKALKERLEEDKVNIELVLRGLQTKLSQFDSQIAEEARLKDSIKTLGNSIKVFDAEAVKISNRIKIDDDLISKKAVIESNYRKLITARQEIIKLRPLVNKIDTFGKLEVNLVNTINFVKQQMENELSNCQRSARELSLKQRETANLSAETAQLISLIKDCEVRLEGLPDATRKYEILEEQLKNRGAERDIAQSELANIKDLLPFLAGSHAACPLCESDLSHGKQQIVYDKQLTKMHELEKNSADLYASGMELHSQKKAAKAIKTELEQLQGELTGHRRLLTSKTAQLENLHNYIKVLEPDVDKLSAIQNKLKSDEYAMDERLQLESTRRELSDLAPKRIEYQTAEQTVATLTIDQTETSFANMQNASDSRVSLIDRLTNISTQRAKESEEIVAAEGKLQQIRHGLEERNRVQFDYSATLTQKQSLDKEWQNAVGRVERSSSAIENINGAKRILAEKQKEGARLKTESQIYNDLVIAFGKKGVQAQIIENILPELQDEANRLLARLTDNSMQVAFNTLRESASGSGAIETLDITITDDSGTRPYELYSGGEAFRVNFAVRIALSRLLAGRSGAKLQALFIDEGFGTQDAKGRERLVEAINSIKDEFKLILVITHFEELKDAFQTRIEITKTPTGSQINMLE